MKYREGTFTLAQYGCRSQWKTDLPKVYNISMHAFNCIHLAFHQPDPNAHDTIFIIFLHRIIAIIITIIVDTTIIITTIIIIIIISLLSSLS